VEKASKRDLLGLLLLVLDRPLDRDRHHQLDCLLALADMSAAFPPAIETRERSGLDAALMTLDVGEDLVPDRVGVKRVKGFVNPAGLVDCGLEQRSECRVLVGRIVRAHWRLLPGNAEGNCHR